MSPADRLACRASISKRDHGRYSTVPLCMAQHRVCADACLASDGKLSTGLHHTTAMQSNKCLVEMICRTWDHLVDVW